MKISKELIKQYIEEAYKEILEEQYLQEIKKKIEENKTKKKS